MNPPDPLCPSRADLRLSIDDLRAFGVVPSQVLAFKGLLQAAVDGTQALPVPTELRPLQVQALRQGVLSDGAGAQLVVGGVGTGKSALAQLIFLHRSHSGQHAVLVLASAAARRRARAQLASTLPDVDLAESIPSPGRLLRRLRREPGFLAEIDCLLIDSLESWLKARRSRRFAALLQRLRTASPTLRIVGFVVEDALSQALNRFAEPLAAEVIYGPAAPALSVWQLYGGSLHPCSAQQQGEGDGPGPASSDGSPDVAGREVLIDPPVPAAPQLRASVLALAGRGQRTLVWVPQHSQRLRLLHGLLASHAGLRPAEQALVELAATAPGHGQELLRGALSHGLALDGDELTPAQRALVARAQARGEVLLTISQRLSREPSLDPRMDNIVYWPPTSRGTRDGADAASPLRETSRRLRRRLQAGGRVILVCHSQAQAERWAERLTAAWVIEGASGRERSSHGHWGWPSGLRFLHGPSTPIARSVSEPLEHLTRAALFTRRLPLPLLLSEPGQSDYLELLLSRAQDLGVAERPVFRWLAHQANYLRHDDRRALKAVLMLDDWLSGLPGPELERRYHVFLGWLVRCARAVVRGLRRLQRADRRYVGSYDGLRSLISHLRRIDPDGVAEHGLAPIGRHIGSLLGALQAQDTALHLRPGSRQVSRR